MHKIKNGIGKSLDLVSVLIPCYNCQATVEEAVRSIIHQTYDNLEILCVDDGSTDNTLSLLLKLAEADSRVIVLRNEGNKGLVYTLNKGVKLCHGSYIARMDSDDFSKPTRIEEELAYLKRNNLDGCGSFIRLFDDSNKILGYKRVPYSFETLRFYTLFDCPMCHPTVLIKAEVLKEYRYSSLSDAYVIEDYDLWCRLLENGYKIGNIKSLLLDYRYNPKGESFTKRDIQRENFIKRSLVYQHNCNLNFFDYFTTAVLCGFCLPQRSQEQLLCDYKHALLGLDSLSYVYPDKEINKWAVSKKVYCSLIVLRHCHSVKFLLVILKLLLSNKTLSVVSALLYIVKEKMCYGKR